MFGFFDLGDDVDFRCLFERNSGRFSARLNVGQLELFAEGSSPSEVVEDLERKALELQRRIAELN